VGAAQRRKLMVNVVSAASKIKVESIFKKQGDDLTIDFSSLETMTSKEFVEKVSVSCGSESPGVGEMKFNGSRKQSFIYFKVDRNYFSFAWDERKAQLIFSRMIENKWSFVVGYQVI
jgi:hypothetical protein